MSLGDQVAANLPYLRRYARALTGSQHTGDAFVRATLEAAADLQKDPKRYFPLISEMTKHPQDQIARSWEHHDFPLRVAPDLLDLIMEEEKWVAAQQKRTPRSRAELAGFIDTSILKEAQGR